MSIQEFYAAFASGQDNRLFSALRKLSTLDDLKSRISKGDPETGPNEWGMWTEMSAETNLVPA